MTHSRHPPAAWRKRARVALAAMALAVWGTVCWGENAPASPPTPDAAQEATPRPWVEIAIDANALPPDQADALRRAAAQAHAATQGVEDVTLHPMTRAECRAQFLATGRLPSPERDRDACGGRPNMAIIPTADGGRTCIDRYEFPNAPCEYPVAWVRADQAAALCAAEGKRLCDAHEWEAACIGKPQPQDWNHPGNARRERAWAYGPERNPSLCAVGQPKSPGCEAAIEANTQVRTACGTNTWPAGSHPNCAGPLGVFDLHGNAAEHMNLAHRPEEAGAAGGRGVTEMKGSWFVFPKDSSKPPHEDDCLWRAPGWHRTRIDDSHSHANYHLGFRCCADAGPLPRPTPPANRRQPRTTPHQEIDP